MWLGYLTFRQHSWGFHNWSVMIKRMLFTYCTLAETKQKSYLVPVAPGNADTPTSAETFRQAKPGSHVTSVSEFVSEKPVDILIPTKHLTPKAHKKVNQKSELNNLISAIDIFFRQKKLTNAVNNSDCMLLLASRYFASLNYMWSPDFFGAALKVWVA